MIEKQTIGKSQSVTTEDVRVKGGVGPERLPVGI